MKGIKKLIVIALFLFLSLVIADTVQAKVNNTSPYLKTTEYYTGGNLYQKQKGFLVDTYVYKRGETKTVFKWEEYNFSSTNKLIEK